MNKYLFEIDNILKNQIKELENLKNIEVDDITLKVLNSYKLLIEEQQKTINKLNVYKNRELDSFIIGDAISDGICVTDNDGIVTAINKGYTEITGITKKEILGQNIKMLIDKGYFSTAVSLDVIKQKKKISSLSVIGKNNKTVLITGSPFFDQCGKIIQVLTVMRDLTELTKLKNDLEKVQIKNRKYLNELNYLRHKNKDENSILGQNTKIRELKELISNIAHTDATVLITGETGCGKEVFANQIYNESDRKNFPYVKVNCAAIPDTLIESELFGYEKGAFTGAQNKQKLGMFEVANGGTILLDEIGEMPFNLQSKLLRVLQERKIRRLGGTKVIKVNVRIIATTNENLSELIKVGKFREDLFYRLNVIPIKIPPLRKRKDDISILSNNFLEKFNIKYSKQKHFDSTAISSLECYNWPGNVRELENVIERLVVINDDEYINSTNIINVIGKDKMTINVLDNNLTLKKAVGMLEKEMIQNALKKYGSTYKAAKVLGVTQPTIFRKAKALGIPLNNTKSIRIQMHNYKF